MAKETIGEYLKRERELRQITLEEVVNGTKIALQRLRQLENDQLEEMPAEIFVRGFIRGYAEFIGLNPDEVLLRYEEELNALREKEAADVGTVYHFEEIKPRRHVLGIIVAVLIFFAIAGTGYWLFLKSGISITGLLPDSDGKGRVIRLDRASFRAESGLNSSDAATDSGSGSPVSSGIHPPPASQSSGTAAGETSQ